jgi:hypothetical protein
MCSRTILRTSGQLKMSIKKELPDHSSGSFSSKLFVVLSGRLYEYLLKDFCTGIELYQIRDERCKMHGKRYYPSL